MAKMMTSFAFSCLCHHRGVSGYAGTPSFQAVEAHTEHWVLVRRDGGPIVPPPPDPGDLAGKYGVQAPAKDFEATLLVRTPHRAILPWARYRRIDPLGLSHMSGGGTPGLSPKGRRTHRSTPTRRF